MNTFSSQAMQQMYVFSCIHFAGQWSLGHRIATYIRVPASVIEVNAAPSRIRDTSGVVTVWGAPANEP